MRPLCSGRVGRGLHGGGKKRRFRGAVLVRVRGAGARRRSCAATTATASTGSDAVPSLHLSREVLINWIFS